MAEFDLIPIAGKKNRVFISLPKEKISNGGILLVETEPKNTEGFVVGVSGHDENGNPPEVKVGDYVYFGEWSGKEFIYEGETFLTLKEYDIYAKRK